MKRMTRQEYEQVAEFYEEAVNQHGTPIIRHRITKKIVGKRCRKCGEVKIIADMQPNRNGADGMRALCLDCKARDSRIQSDARQIERAERRNLPAESTAELDFSICALSGIKERVQQEHFIPISWGHGGTIPENMYGLTQRLNASKGAKNPFVWFEESGKRFSDEWGRLVNELANRNGMSVSEYESFVNWCEHHQRTDEQILEDNERYGYVVDSKTLYFEANKRIFKII